MQVISYIGWTKKFVTFVQVILSSPVLNEGELELLLKDPYLKPQVLPTFFDIRKGVEGSLEKTLIKLCAAADEAVRNGSQLLVLSDRSDDLVITPWFSLFHL
jgi:glutamate synthase (ferredoxin)